MIINMVGGGGGFSPSNAILGVTAYAGSTVTITNGTVTKTVTQDKSHVLSDLSDFAIYYFGIPSGMFSSSVPWNITSTYQSEQTTATVIINTNAFYDVVLTYRIPYDYQEVEYLESNGSQYIDTLIHTDSIGKFNAKVMIIQYSEYHSQNFWVFGGSSGSKESDSAAFNGFGIIIDSFNTIFLNINNSSYYFLEYNFGYAGDLSVTLTGSANYSFYIPSVTTKQVYNIGTPSITFSGNLYLFTAHFSDGVKLTTVNKNRFYSCEIYNRQNEKVSNLIPCYRKLDSVAGMYDNVNKRFLTNQGTGTFVVGSDVT